MTKPKGKVIIAGGSGFLGQKLACSLIEEGFEVMILGRREKSGLKGEFVQWDAKNLGDWLHELEGATAIFNLTGRSVDCRYTEENKSLILNSRIDSTKVLGEAIRLCDNPPAVWLNASTATIYNDRRGDLPAHDEHSEGNAEGFSEEVGRAWEKAFFDAGVEGVRQVSMRISIVLGNGGGAFPVMRRLTKFGLGGKQGPGDQWISWLHIADWVGIAKFLMKNSSISGPVNLAAPNPVTNKEFMSEMRAVFAPLGIGFPAPCPAIYLGAILMGTSPELVLKSRKVISSVLSKQNFQFKYPEVHSAINALK